MSDPQGVAMTGQTRARGRVLVATADGLQDASGRVVALGGRAVDALAVAGDGWWAIIDNRELWASEDGGGPRRITAVGDGTATALLTVHADVLVGTEPAHLWRLRNSSLERLRGFDATPGRGDWHTPWGGPAAVRSMSRAADGTPFVNVHVGGIVRGEPDGSWRPTIDVDADVHEVATHPDDASVVLAATARGLAVSEDRGERWRFVTAGLHAGYCRAVAIDADTGAVYVSASTGPSTSDGRLYRTAYGDWRLEAVAVGGHETLPGNIDSGCVAAGSAAVAVGTPDSAVYVSEDRGGSWERTAGDLPRIRAVRLM